jgi:hypothetical protein
MQPEYNLSWILPYVRLSIPSLATIFKFDEFADGVYALLAKQATPTIQKRPANVGHTGQTYNVDAIRKDIKAAVTEAFYYCEQNRFILRQPPTHASYIHREGFNPSGNEYLVTPRGQEWAKSVEPLPEDYDGYMRQFPATTDIVVREYIGEALHTFIVGTHFACAVMIGAASEKCIYLLADALLPALRDPAKQAALRKKMDDRSLDRLLKGVEEIIIDGHKAKIIPFDVMGGTTRHLVSIFDHIRLQRNDAIHPMNFNVSADSVRLALMAFPMAFERIDALRQWCSANPASL